jgi:hypothetical protein
MLDPVIAHADFVDGARRPIFEQLDGRQYVCDDDGQRLYGVWIIPAAEDQIDLPTFVHASGVKMPSVRP